MSVVLKEKLRTEPVTDIRPRPTTGRGNRGTRDRHRGPGSFPVGVRVGHLRLDPSGPMSHPVTSVERPWVVLGPETRRDVTDRDWDT